MATELSQELIRHLVEVGQTDQFDSCDELPVRYPASSSGTFMRLAPESWYEVAASLTDHDLAALIKTLTVLEERLPEFRAGSVSPVIWLFRRLSDRSPADLTPLVDWVLAHTENPYLPFGTWNFDAKSSAELAARSALSRERRTRGRADEANRQLEAERRRSAAATRKLFGALRRRDDRAIAALLAQGADIRAENEHGQTALDFAQSVGLRHLLAPCSSEDDEHGASPATNPAPER